MGVFVYQAIFDGVKSNRIVSTGIDSDPVTAKAKAISESVERYACDLSKISTNGVAAHPCMDTAKQKALDELLERDALMCSWYTRGPLYSIDLESPTLSRIRTEMDRHHYRLQFFKIPHESSRIIIACCAWTSRVDQPAFFMGAAAGSVLETVALKAALEVAAQLLPTLRLSKSTKDLRDHFPRFSWGHTLAYFDHRHFEPLRAWMSSATHDRKQQSRQLSEVLWASQYSVLDFPEVSLLGRHIVRATSESLQDLIFETEDKKFNKQRLKNYAINFGGDKYVRTRHNHPFG